MEPDAPEPLEPDAIFLPGEGQEGRNVNADEAYPPLDKVNARRVRRRYPRAGGRGGPAQETVRERGDRGKSR